MVEEAKHYTRFCPKLSLTMWLNFNECQNISLSFITSSLTPKGGRISANSVFEERAEIPLIIIASVSVAGILLLILNVVLLYCFIQNRKSENNISHVIKRATLKEYCSILCELQFRLHNCLTPTTKFCPYEQI